MKNLYEVYEELKNQGATEDVAFQTMISLYNEKLEKGYYSEDDDLPF